MAADILLTWLGANRRRRYGLPVGIVPRAYLAFAGLVSVGVLFLVLGTVQIGLLVRRVQRRALSGYRNPAGVSGIPPIGVV